MKTTFLAVLIFVLTAAVQAQAQNDSTSSSFVVPAVEHYKLLFAIDPEHHTLSAQADINVRNSAKRTLTVVPVLLYRLMEIEAASDAQGKALAFIQKVVKFADDPNWQVNYVQVTLPTPLAPGQTATIRLKYAGPLFGYREVMMYVKDTISEEYSLIRSETMAYPMVAAPSYAGWRQFFRNKF
jgi:hypothetical protein